MGIEATVFGFTDRLSDYMQQADFAIARAGASTLWELSATACPALYIPYPYAAGDHQYHNAKFLEQKDVAWIMRENEIDNSKILSILEKDMSQKSKKLQSMIESDGARLIAEMLVNEQ